MTRAGFYGALFVLAALALSSIFMLSRVSRLYPALWEDEVHYHHKAFEAPSLRDLRYEIKEVFKPCLDFALRRWAWFSPAGLELNERNLRLVGWLYAWGHLLLWLCVPWTSSWALRLGTAVLLGLCPVEDLYSTDAQGYPFYSFGSALVFFGLLLSLRWAQTGRPWPALLLGALWLSLGLNLHFFFWPALAGLSLLLTARCAYLAPSPAARRPLFWGGLALAGAAFWLSAELNHPSLTHLWRHPPAGTAQLRWAWGPATELLAQAWTWLLLPGWLFLALALPGAWHPDPAKRWAWVATVACLFPVKFVLALAVMARSTYLPADRYFIFFIAPALLCLGLGLDSLYTRLERALGAVAPALGAALLALLIFQRTPLLARHSAEAGRGAAMLARRPANSSPTFQLFEAAKAQGKPLLVLGDHPWALDIPKFYLGHLGQRPTAQPRVLDVSGHETSTDALRAGIASFRALSASTGSVLFFYDRPYDGLAIPCPKPGDFLLHEPTLPCAGILKPARIKRVLDDAAMRLSRGSR